MIESLVDSSDLIDFTYGFDESFRINTGIEVTYLNILALRGGYRFNDAGRYSLGIGFNYVIKNVSFLLDTSYSDAGIFGPVYSFTVTFKLIPHVITVKDQLIAEKHYRKGIKYYIANDLEAAIDEFKKCKKRNPYHKNVKQKLEDLIELKEIREENEQLDLDNRSW